MAGPSDLAGFVDAPESACVCISPIHKNKMLKKNKKSWISLQSSVISQHLEIITVHKSSWTIKNLSLAKLGIEMECKLSSFINQIWAWPIGDQNWAQILTVLHKVPNLFLPTQEVRKHCTWLWEHKGQLYHLLQFQPTPQPAIITHIMVSLSAMCYIARINAELGIQWNLGLGLGWRQCSSNVSSGGALEQKLPITRDEPHRTKVLLLSEAVQDKSLQQTKAMCHWHGAKDWRILSCLSY